MALIDKLTVVADAIRGKTGKEELLTLEQMATEISAIDTQAKTYILMDEDGNEIPAVLVDEPVEITATANDIRIGTTAVTADGVTVGTKEIPSYNTQQGRRLIRSGKPMEISMYSDQCQYTKLQVIVCAFNTTTNDSVSAQLVVIDNKVYEVNSITPIANVTVDTEKQSIKLGLDNESASSVVLVYMTIKEEE